MKFTIILNPGKQTLEIFKKRIHRPQMDWTVSDAIGLIQGNVLEMMYAADIAEKSAAVQVADMSGNCPQHLVTIVIVGDSESVKTALDTVKIGIGDKNVSC